MNHNYSKLTDDEWIELLLSKPQDKAGAAYFVTEKCKPLLSFIFHSLYKERCKDGAALLSDFYLYLSHDDWRVIRLYQARRGASLGTYVSTCANRYFTQKRRKQEQTEKMFSSLDDTPVEYCNHESEDNENSATNLQKIGEAFERLNERDQKILRYHIIEQKDYLDIADEMWQYVHTPNRDWRQLPVKRVQDTLAIIKKRALYHLYCELHSPKVSKE